MKNPGFSGVLAPVESVVKAQSIDSLNETMLVRQWHTCLKPNTLVLSDVKLCNILASNNVKHES